MEEMKSVQRESVLVLYNQPENQPENPAPDRAAWRESEAGVLDQVRSVTAALEELGLPCRREALTGLADLAPALDRGRERLVVNLVEEFSGRPFESDAVPEVCEIYGRSCTGATAAALLLAFDKLRAKDLLRRAGLACPAGFSLAPGQPPPADLPRGPLIAKPLRADGSEGIDASSILRPPAADRHVSRDALKQAAARIHEQFGQPALVEEFIEGRELNVSVIERGGRPEVLPIAEIDFSAFPPGEPWIVDYSAKWLPRSFAFHHTPRIIPADLPPATARAVREAAADACRALGCRDYTRVDFRLDAQGRLYVLEVNPNPDISPEAGFAAALAAAGITFPRFVRLLLDNAARRLADREPAAAAPPAPGSTRSTAAKGRHPAPTAAGPASARAPAPEPLIRRSQPGDRDPILRFLEATGFFPAVDLEVAREVLDQALAEGEAGDYQSFTALADGRPVGWICYGATPCTMGTFDVYWIGVDARTQARGLGTRLLEHAERLIRERGGRLVVIETSGRPLYQPTRLFYLARGYREEGRIRDFYAPGDDRVIYVKHLG
jgi:D-alanine-D-alanine ligase